MTSCLFERENDRQENSEFQGNWIGYFEGEQNGTIEFEINNTGNIEGGITLKPENTTEIIKGYVHFGGKFDMNSKSNIVFTGHLINIGNTETTGSWIRNYITGHYFFRRK